MPIAALSKTTTWQIATNDTDGSEEVFNVTFAYCEDFDGDGFDDVHVTIALAPGSNSGTEDIQGIGFDLNGDVDDLFTTGTMSIQNITTNAGYTGPITLDIDEQNADTPFNDTPPAATGSPFDVTIAFDAGSSTGEVQSVSFLITDSAGDVDHKDLLDLSDWYVRTQSTDGGGGSAKTKGTAPELEDCDDHHPPKDDFPELDKDISNVVFYFKAGEGAGKVDPDCDTNNDGFYTVKIDDWFDAADNDLDEYYQDILDFLIAEDDCVNADDEVLGVAIKSGKNAFAAGTGVFSVSTKNDTAFFAVGDGDTDPDPLPAPLTQPITASAIDKSYDFDDVFMLV